MHLFFGVFSVNEKLYIRARHLCRPAIAIWTGGREELRPAMGKIKVSEGSRV